MAKKTVGKTIRRKTVHVTLPSGKVMTEFQIEKATNRIVRDAIGFNFKGFDENGKQLFGAEKCKHLRHRRTENGLSNIKWMEHSNRIVKGVCGTCFAEFDTRKPEDLLLWQQDPRAAKNMGRAIDPNPPKLLRWFQYDLQPPPKRLRLFQYDLQPPVIPTPWYFRAADAIINAVEATEEAIEKAWAALRKVIANGDFHHRS
jgi:hypothetical protein